MLLVPLKGGSNPFAKPGDVNEAPNPGSRSQAPVPVGSSRFAAFIEGLNPVSAKKKVRVWPPQVAQSTWDMLGMLTVLLKISALRAFKI